MSIRSSALVLATLLALPATAAAQPPSPLAAALVARYPTHELVPQSCAPGPEPIVVSAGRICLRDVATGLIRTVRRVALVSRSAGATAARRGTDVVFSVSDDAYEDSGSVSTRLGGRVWHWDLTRDAYIGLANAGYGGAFATSFGLFYRAGDGTLRRFDATGPVVVTWPSGSPSQGSLLVVGDTTFVARSHADETVIATVTDAGGTITEAPFATIPGSIVLASRGTVITVRRSSAGSAIHVLRLPATTATVVPLPPRSSAPSDASWVDADTVRLTRWRTPARRLDLRTFALTAESAPPTPAPELLALSHRAVTPIPAGLRVNEFELDARGARRTDPAHRRPTSSLCTCEAAVLVCASGARVEDACSEVPELDHVEGGYDGRGLASTLFSRGGTLRFDRLEVDYVRITRLRDGARLWVRIFPRAVLAQLDDGTYYLSDRSLEPLLALRDGGSLTTGPVVPLPSRADALYRPTLVADFFAAL